MTAIVPTMTDSGFLFGPAKVSASASDNGGNVWVGVASKRASLSVHLAASYECGKTARKCFLRNDQPWLEHRIAG